ncbi:MAG TPA: excinuclease ABC subunit UvrA [Gammaproteobacteria bacterium]|nr:excinuclease ABC subunit UvrA [Gammaproteobacteria bacterium]
MDAIRIRGARTHNLKNVDLDLPRERLIVITGLSGSGKSSLAFDTLYAEGQRRYVESLSAYARQFLALMEKPDADSIEGLSPAIAIEQKASSHNPRSTVGTVTEIYDYLRLLYARAGTPRCPTHGIDLDAQTVSQMVDAVLARPEGERVMLLAPLVRARKGEHAELLAQLKARGFLRVRVDGEVLELDEAGARLDRARAHTIELVVDRLRARADAAARLAESFETALAFGDGNATVVSLDDSAREPLVFSARYACPVCGWSLAELKPRLFSFNNPAGACPVCDGLGAEQFFDPARIVARPTLSLAGGALRGWDRRNPYYFEPIRSLARHYEFDPETPFAKLPERIRGIVLYGSGEEEIRFEYLSSRGRRYTRAHAFEGIVRILERRYRETESLAVREELARYRAIRPCPACGGARLNEAARSVFVAGRNIAQVVALDVLAAHDFFASLALPGRRGEIAARIVREVESRLRFLRDVGLGYLTLARSAETLSGGEAQRIRLASQIGSGLTGVMYVLDEPSIGLHQRDNRRLIETLLRLRDLGNTVIVVEHDEETIRAADFLVDMGPGAGAHGGEIVALGTAAEIEAAPGSLTGDYLAGRRAIPVPPLRRIPSPEREIRIRGARGNNLANLDVAFPLGLLTCVTGVSGSGKSTLVSYTLEAAAARALNRANAAVAPCDAIEGLEHLDKVIAIDQNPIGRTPRSNPATYTGLLAPVRELFAQTPEARARGYKPGRFSFNVRGGRCEACQGDGLIKVEMHFLPDLYVPCDVCHGARYNRETLEVRYKGRNIHEVLEMTVEEASAFFANVPAVRHRLETLAAVGLGYVRLGQSATTLSGGEAQRVKLARELARRDTGRVLYVLDEPTTGLHFHDIRQLLAVLLRLREHGNSIVVIEHNLEVIKTADWIIDLGPEGGAGGGRVVACGSPEAVAANPASHTGAFLARELARTASRTDG